MNMLLVILIIVLLLALLYCLLKKRSNGNNADEAIPTDSTSLHFWTYVNNFLQPVPRVKIYDVGGSAYTANEYGIISLSSNKISNTLAIDEINLQEITLVGPNLKVANANYMYNLYVYLNRKNDFPSGQIILSGKVYKRLNLQDGYNNLNVLLKVSENLSYNYTTVDDGNYIFPPFTMPQSTNNMVTLTYGSNVYKVTLYLSAINDDTRIDVVIEEGVG